MLKIGAFSKLSQTSVKTLRFYEANELFSPAYVDPHSGYRYYSADQVTELGQILHLRTLGFSLRQIRDVVSDSGRLRTMLLDKRDELECRVRDERARIAGVDGWLDRLARDSEPPSHAVTLKRVGAHLIASIRRPIACYSEAVELFDELRHCTKPDRMGAEPAAAIWHTCGALEGPIDCEAYIPVRRCSGASRRVRVYEVPATMMASVVCRGDSSTSAGAYAATRSWIAAHGFEISGPKRELYWRGRPDDDRDSDITEIQFPIAIRTGASSTRQR
jgi:DNA-binding transcriptional MerR regulator